MLEDHQLPLEIRQVTHQSSCPFGDGVLALTDAVLAAETCEELFTPQVKGTGQMGKVDVRKAFTRG